MPRTLTKCPGCGEPVSPFAAGCALCGVDLEAPRRAIAEKDSARHMPRPGLPRGISFGRSGEFLFCGVMALLAVFTPPLGLLFNGLMAYRFHHDDNALLRNVALVCAAAAMLFLAFPFGIWSRVLSALA